MDHEVVEAIEFDEKTMHSYNLIHNSDFKSKDITLINPSEFPDHDLLFYSPPCQAFSVAGKQEGFDDSKGRGMLFFEALKVIQAKKPKYAIMENVKGLTQKKFQFEFETMLQLLEQEGYNNYWKVLNAADYGIAHHRERVFIVSIRKDIEQNFMFPGKENEFTSLSDLLEPHVDEKYYLSEVACLRLNTIDKRAKDKGLGFKNIFVNIHINDNGEFYEQESQLFLNLDANFFKGPDGKRTMINVIPDSISQSEYSGLRMPTPLECLRLMGFEDKDYFKLKLNNISNSQIYKMSGNSIVVNVVEKILKQLIPQYIKSSEALSIHN
nr:DNA (cytosine-5-)-methyltransferase [Paenibacillus tianjinensis]